MSIGMIILTCILSLLGALIVFMVIRALLTRPTPLVSEGDYPLEDFDANAIAQRLSGGIQIPTLTVLHEGQSYQPFLDFQAYLEKNYPEIFARGEKTLINGYSMILKIVGTDESLKPACYLSHQDVVPVNEELWTEQPFGGEIKDGYIYGRGSMDMKGHMFALLEGLERRLSTDGVPKRTIYLCFGHDEEITGKDGARHIVEYLAENKIQMEYVIDEGGAILDGAVLGVNNKIALIGTCEKGYVDYKLTAKIDGGHASSPRKKSSVNAISEAIFDLSHLPMKAYWSQPIKDTFKTLAPYMKFPFKLLFVNYQILAPLLKLVLTKANPLTNSIMRTTFAFTQMKGADAPNVIPSVASAVVNVRINIGQTQAEVKEYIQKVVGKHITVTELNPGFEPTSISKIDNQSFADLKKTVAEVFAGYVPCPYPFIAATDAKYYGKICDSVYRFGPIECTVKDQERVHAEDERCGVEHLKRATQFFARLIQNTCY